MAKAKHRTPRDKRITVGTASYPAIAPFEFGDPCRQVPYIRLKGHWLTLGGFVPGTTFDVRLVDGCIVLVPV